MKSETDAENPNTDKPEPTKVEKPEPSRGSEEPTAVALRTLQGEHATATALLKERDNKIAELERDLKVERSKVDAFGKREREARLISVVRKDFPHASDLELQGAIAGLAEQGKIDRFTDKPDEVAKTAVDLIKEHAPAIARGPVQGGGPGGPPRQEKKGPQRDALRERFGMRGKQ
ncbi:hypothetical protein OV203_02490 [Nannocystis sp. ILAH1]|uniref:hypothetical protein n=1 Tax=Nannocystis sp. ILAH1 TaxID=2996789 RepID=UPI00226F4B31|nr:hypothetical protein [Nannocystis sp. ILAH1]MCY0985980.1 hypothetical protein [Nannocystis sp. ILAH1]